jgi:glycosyltransferase involved in cell wall biosynthesis
MRVALVLGASVGGIGTHVRDLAEHCVARGEQVVVAGPAATEAHFGFTAAGARFVPVCAPPALRRVLAAADVVHSHGLKAAARTNLARATLPAARRPRHVVTLHNAAPATGVRAHISGLIERVAIRPADVVLGAGADLVEQARRRGARRAALCAVPAPPLAPAARDRDAVRAELALREGESLLLAVGRLAPQKSYPLLLDAVAVLVSQHPQTRLRLLVAGEGPERGALAARIAADALPVTLLGHRADVADLLAAADVFVLCSRWEARALVVQEALRAAVPVVATAVGALPDLVGDAAVLVPWDDPAALAAALREVLGDDALRERLRYAGPRRAATWPGYAEALDRIREWYRA